MHVLVRRTTGSFAVLLLSSLVAPARAQGGGETFFRTSDIAWAGAFAAASLGVSRLDPRIAKFFQQPEQQDNQTMHRVSEGFTNVQETTLTISGIVTYGVARLVKARNVEVFALHASESIVFASITRH
jgi:hypothetical protein